MVGKRGLKIESVTSGNFIRVYDILKCEFSKQFNNINQQWKICMYIVMISKVLPGALYNFLIYMRSNEIKEEFCY